MEQNHNSQKNKHVSFKNSMKTSFFTLCSHLFDCSDELLKLLL